MKKRILYMAVCLSFFWNLNVLVAQNKIDYVYEVLEAPEEPDRGATVKVTLPGKKRSNCYHSNNFKKGNEYSGTVNTSLVKHNNLKIVYDVVFSKRKKNSTLCLFNVDYNLVTGPGDHAKIENNSQKFDLIDAVINKPIQLGKETFGKKYTFDGKITFKLPKKPQKNYLKIRKINPKGCSSLTSDICFDGKFEFQEVGIGNFFTKTFINPEQSNVKTKLEVQASYSTHLVSKEVYVVEQGFYSGNGDKYDESSYYFYKIYPIKHYSNNWLCMRDKYVLERNNNNSYQDPYNNNQNLTRFRCTRVNKLLPEKKWNRIRDFDMHSGSTREVSFNQIDGLKDYVKRKGEAEVYFKYRYINNTGNGGVAQTTAWSDIAGPYIIRPKAPDFKSISFNRGNKIKVSNNETIELKPICLTSSTDHIINVDLNIQPDNMWSNRIKFFVRLNKKVNKNPCSVKIKNFQKAEKFDNSWFTIGKDSYSYNQASSSGGVDLDLNKALKLLADGNKNTLSFDLIAQNSDGNGLCNSMIHLEIPIIQPVEFSKAKLETPLICPNQPAKFSFTSKLEVSKYWFTALYNNKIIASSFRVTKKNNLYHITCDIPYNNSRTNDIYKVKYIDRCGRESIIDLKTNSRPTAVSATIANPIVSCNNPFNASILLSNFKGGKSKAYKIGFLNLKTNYIEAFPINNISNEIIMINNPGIYRVLLIDNQNDCNVTTLSKNYKIDPLPNFGISLIPDSRKDNVCFGESKGAIAFSIPNNNNDLNYQLSATTINGSIEDRIGKLDISGQLSFNNLKEGAYTLLVTRDVECQEVEKFEFEIKQPDPITVNSKIERPSCIGEENARISLQISGGNSAYGYKVSLTSKTTGRSKIKETAHSSAIFEKLTSGYYILKVETFFNKNRFCPIAFTKEIYIKPVTPLTLDLIKPNLSCLTPMNSVLSINNIVSDSKVVDIELKNSKNEIVVSRQGYSEATFISNALEAGSYSLTVVDNIRKACNPYESTFEVKPLSPLHFNIIKTKSLTCFNVPEGEIILSTKNKKSKLEVMRNGKPFYNQIINGEEIIELVDLAAGIYDVNLKRQIDNCNEVFEQSIEIKQPQNISVKEQIIHVQCEGGTDGSILASISGGTAPYSVSWFLQDDTRAFKTEQTDRVSIDNRIAGNYILRITDQNKCDYTDFNYTIKQPKQLTADIELITTGCEKPLDAALIIANIKGGDAKYDILLTREGEKRETIASMIGTSMNIFNFKSLTPASYRLKIIDSNRPDCQVIDYPFEVNALPPLTVSIDKVNNIQCHAETNGIGIFKLSGSSSYYYNLFKNNTLIKEGTTKEDKLKWFELEKGAYDLKVYRSKSCETMVSTSFEILEPEPIKMEAQKVDITTNGLNNGSLNILVSGGWSGYTISWFRNGNPFNTTTPFQLSNLSKGIYYAIIIDMGGCKIKTEQWTIVEPAPLSFDTIEEQSKTCDEEQFFVKLNPEVSGGWPPYNYYMKQNNSEWNPIDFNQNIAAGNLKFKVIDRENNEAVFDKSVEYFENKGLLSVDFESPQFSDFHIACAGGATASLTIIGYGGAGGYVYQMENSEWQSNATFKDLTVGTYSIAVKDRNGCISNKTILLTEPKPLKMNNLKTSDVKCFGDYAGAFEFDISGGVSPYQYSIDNGKLQSLPSFNGLTAGVYNLLIVDSNDCQLNEQVTIKSINPPILLNPIVVDVSCPSEATGQIKLNPKGGKRPYTFKWEDGPITQDRVNLAVGFYNVTLMDAEGCLVKEEIEITEPQILLLPENKTICKNETITLNATHEEGISYNWTLNGQSISHEAKNVFGKPGKYEVEVTLKSGCVITDDFVFSTSDVEFSADFLLATYNKMGDTVLLVETSSRIPENIKWTFDEQITQGMDESGQPWIIAPKIGIYEISLEAWFNGCSSNMSKLISFNEETEEMEPLSDQQFKQRSIEKFEIHPNPTDGEFTVTIKQATKEPLELIIMSNDRLRVLDSKVDPTLEMNQMINISDQPNGVYIVIVRSKLSQKAKRIILNR